MNDFVAESGCLVRADRHSVLEDISLVILWMPVFIMIGLAWRKGMVSTEAIVEFLSNQNQFHIAVFAFLAAFVVFRLFLYRGICFIFDRDRNELLRIRMFRLRMRWVERWRLSEIVSIDAEPYGHESWGMAQVVVRFRNGDSVTVREGADRGSSLVNIRRIADYLGIGAAAAAS